MNAGITGLRAELRQLPAWLAVLLTTAALLVLGVKTLGAIAIATAHALTTLLVLVAVIAEWAETAAADAAGITPLSAYAAVPSRDI